MSDANLESFKAAALRARRATSERGFLADSVRHMARVAGTERCSVLLLEDGILRDGAAVGLPDDYREAIDGVEIGPEVGTCGTAAYLGRPVVTCDIRADDRWTGFHELAEAAGLRSCWAVPLLRADETVIGTFAGYATEPYEPSPEQLQAAQVLASLVAVGLERLRHEERLAESYESVVIALTSALDLRDANTATLATETSRLAVAVAWRMGVEGTDLHRLEQVAALHDIGKLGIPAQILRSPHPLSPEEWAIVRQHPIIGEQILAKVPELVEVARAVRHEHERWDGGGYPDGLAGSAIPVTSRIVFACDVWHAMASDRPYRSALERSAAVQELRDQAGTQFDPEVIEHLLRVLGEERGDSGVTSPREIRERIREDTLREVAARVGADDLLIFRRVSPDKFAHFGGVGRGEGWAGNIELSTEHAEEHFVAALTGGRPVCLAFEGRGRVVGPYFAGSAVIVPCRDDVVVVLGAAGDALSGPCTEETIGLAKRAASVVVDIAPAKRLADELEVLEAVRSITTIATDGLSATLDAIADRTAAALSCEFGAVVAFAPNGEAWVGHSDRGWMPAAPDDLAGCLMPLVSGELELPFLIQDCRRASDAAARLAERGATSIHALPIGVQPPAVMLMVHADRAPRGFTMLCQRVARAVAEAAEVVIRRALAQEELTEENRRLEHRIHTDALTGVASRAAWEEALAREDLHLARSGAPTSIALFDLDALKAANDEEGHAAGDRLLRECASVLADTSRATDLVARIGGDEFAALLRYTDEDSARAWCARVHRAIAARNADSRQRALSVASGVASVPPAGSLDAALAEADRRMYAAKQRADRAD